MLLKRSIAKYYSSRKYVWLEEYEHCGCSNVTETRHWAVGYCPQHGTDRKRINRIPNQHNIQLGHA